MNSLQHLNVYIFTYIFSLLLLTCYFEDFFLKFVEFEQAQYADVINNADDNMTNNFINVLGFKKNQI